jgi:hypothetical protein
VAKEKVNAENIEVKIGDKVFQLEAVPADGRKHQYQAYQPAKDCKVLAPFSKLYVAK